MANALSHGASEEPILVHASTVDNARLSVSNQGEPIRPHPRFEIMPGTRSKNAKMALAEDYGADPGHTIAEVGGPQLHDADQASSATPADRRGKVTRGQSDGAARNRAIPATMAATNTTTCQGPKVIAVRAGPGHSPTRPQPMPNRAAPPPIRRPDRGRGGTGSRAASPARECRAVWR